MWNQITTIWPVNAKNILKFLLIHSYLSLKTSFLFCHIYTVSTEAGCGTWDRISITSKQVKRSDHYEFYVQSNLGSRTPRILNNSVYEQIFRTQSVSDDVLCLELRTRKPSTSWSDKLGVSASAVFVEERSSGKYPESATPIGESVSCCVAFVHSNSLCLLLNFSVFCVFL